jgi:hypothetical protein
LIFVPTPTRLAEGLIVINSSVESVLQVREDRRREFEDRSQRFFDDKDALPPEIRVRIEADRAASAIAHWVARARYAATWLRKQAGARIRSHRR